MRRTSTLLVAAVLGTTIVCAGSVPTTPFTLSDDPAEAVLRLSFAATTAPYAVEWTVYGDGRLEKVEKYTGDPAKRREVRLSTEQVRDLVGHAVTHGLADADERSLDAKEAFHWYRSADNDPVVVDNAVIDLNTYRRSPGTLPPGSSFAANANRLVAAALGYTNTQAVMYPLDARARVFTGLTADDVNMVMYAKTGQDRTAGTSDDYTVALRYQSSCTGAHVQARLSSLGSTANGRCFANAAWSYDQTGEPFAFHWTLVPLPASTFIELHVNTVPLNSTWDFGAHIFSGEGEAGDLREWDGIFP